jgi:hypothetical protein
MSRYVFGAILIIAYLIWTFDCIRDLIQSYYMDKSIQSSSALWLITTLLAFIIGTLIIKT